MLEIILIAWAISAAFLAGSLLATPDRLPSDSLTFVMVLTPVLNVIVLLAVLVGFAFERYQEWEDGERW